MRRPALRDTLVLLGFAALSFAMFGWRLLPHPGRFMEGSGPDPEIFIWAFAWWPHALFGWTNPFVTHALYAPQGANLAWTTAVPSLSIPLIPLTLLAGPMVTFNAAALLLPALAAWTAYRLCYHLTASLWASLVGGYLFGFSSFLLAQQLQGHLNLTGEFLLPIVALSLVRLVQGELSRGGFALRFGVAMALQLGISTEVALTATLMVLCGLALAALIVTPMRSRLRMIAESLVAGYAVGGLLATPLVIYALLNFPRNGFTGAETSDTDLLNTVVATSVNGITGTWFGSVQPALDLHESGLYLGPPTLLIVVLFAWRWRRWAWGRFLLAALALTLLLALGTALLVNGQRLAPLPWSYAARYLPGLDNVHAPRFSEYAALAAAVAVAVWTARTRGRVFARPYVLPVLAVAALVPVFWQTVFVSKPLRVPFFADGLYRSCLPRNEVIAVLPYGLDVDLWQAEANFDFRVAGGYLTPPVFGAKPVIAFNEDPVVYEFNFFGDRGVPTPTALLAFANRHDVGRFIALPGSSYASRGVMGAFGEPENIGGVVVSPACGTPPLTTRPLSPAVRLLDREERRGLTIGWCHGGYFYSEPVDLHPASLLQGATKAVFVAGQGLACSVPSGYVLHGLAPASLGVPAGTYAYYTK